MASGHRTEQPVWRGASNTSEFGTPATSSKRQQELLDSSVDSVSSYQSRRTLQARTNNTDTLTSSSNQIPVTASYVDVEYYGHGHTGQRRDTRPVATPLLHRTDDTMNNGNDLSNITGFSGHATPMRSQYTSDDDAQIASLDNHIASLYKELGRLSERVLTPINSKLQRQQHEQQLRTQSNGHSYHK
jgi:hypothetical protein